MPKNVNNRLIALAGIFILFGVILLTQLFKLQIIEGEVNYEKSQSRLISDRRIAAPRGNIVDRYGAPLATSRQGFTVQICKTGLKTEQLNELLLNLITLLEKNGDKYINNLSRYLMYENENISYGTSIVKTGEDDAALSEEDKNQKKIDKIKKDIGITYKDFTAKNPEEVFEYFKSKRMFNISDNYTTEQAYKIMCLRFELLIKGFTIINPITLATDVSDNVVAIIDERHDDFPGVTTEVMYARTYNNADIASHVIGYISTMDPDSYKILKEQGYRMDDQIGKAGVEAAAEKYLKGVDGIKNVEMDIRGRTTKELSVKSPEPGKSVILTIDSKLQKVAMDSLERNINEIRNKGGSKNFGDAVAGATVAIDVRNGEILAMASYPSYDPSIFLEGADNTESQKKIMEWMTDEKTKPMLNRTTQEIYQPGSTFKPITAIAGLEEGKITRTGTITDTGTTNIGGKDFLCMEFRDYKIVHGPLTVSQALANSCNIFFHELGARTGIDNIDKWAKSFGLGEKAKIDIDPLLEAKGFRANRVYKKERADGINKPIIEKAKKEGRTLRQEDLEYDVWTPADTAQSSIGQLYNSFTPLQLVNYISTLANGGTRFKPHIIKKIVDTQGNMVQETKPEFEKISISPDTIQTVKEGMIAVTNAQDGTAVGLFNGLYYNGEKVQVAGKTGTAETGYESKQSSNALFVCYAPADNPQIAVAVVVEKGVWGAYTAPIARDILQEYFSSNDTSVDDDKVKSEEAILTR